MILQPSPDNPMLLFGCGNMGRAMLDGWLAGGFEPAAFLVVDPFATGLPKCIAYHADASTIDRRFKTALLAIKPQVFAEAAATFERLLAPNALVVSILAGTRCETLAAQLPGRSIIRLMPNLAASLGKSPLGLFSDDATDQRSIEQLLAPLGSPFWLADEAQMDAVTALAGSGPAFVYRFIDALAQAGAKIGLGPELAQGVALSMVEGAAELAATSGTSPEELARRVTSPGGTTAAGLAVLDENDALASLIEATLAAARDRGITLSGA